MRLHIGISPGGAKKGQTALIIVEHLDMAPQTPMGKIEKRNMVIHIERMMPNLETIRDRIKELVEQTRAERPCFFLDATSSLGAGIWKVLANERKDGEWPKEIHPVHPYTKRGVARQALVNSIVESYGSGRLKFADKLPMQAELIKALGTYESQITDDGRISFGGDDELVAALGLAIAYHSHGHTPRYLLRGGGIAESRSVSKDPY